MIPKRLLAFTLFAALAVMQPCVLRAQWQPMDGLPLGVIQTSASNGSETFIWGDGGISRTTDNGLSWIPSNKGVILNGTPALLGDSGVVMISSDSGTYFWSDNSSEWIKRGQLQGNDQHAYSFIVEDGIFYAGTVNSNIDVPVNHIERSTDQGFNWKIIDSSLYDDIGFTVIDTFLFTGNEFGRIFRSSDSGNHWISVDSEVAGYNINYIATDGKNLLALNSIGIWLSSDFGATWEKFTNNPGWFDFINLTILGNTIFAVSLQGLFCSSDQGSSWQSPSSLPGINCLTSNGETLFAGSGGEYISYDTGKSWVLANTGLYSEHASSLLPCANTLYANVGSAIFRSTDSGYTWSFYLDGSPSSGNYTLNSIASIANIGTNYYAGSYGVFLTTDGGNTWIPRDSGLPLDNVVSLISVNSKLFAGTAGNGVFVSSDSGATWNEANNGLSSDLRVSSLCAVGGDIVEESSSPPYGLTWGIFISSNEGKTWVSHGEPPASIKFLTSIDTFIFGLSSYGMYRASINDSDWVSVGSALGAISVVAPFDSMLFAGTQQGVFVSYDNGDNWVEQDSGMRDTSVTALTIYDGMVYASAYSPDSEYSYSYYPTIWRRSLSELTTSPHILGASADTINFGNIPVGTDALRIDAVTNVGTSAITIQSFPLTQSQDVFSTSDLSGEVELNPGESFTFEAFFMPTQAGAFSANIGIISEAKAINIVLVGSAGNVAEVEEPSQPDPALTIAPNPFTQSTEITFTSPTSGYAEVSIVNMLGVEVARLFSGELGAGEHNFSWSDPTGLQDGVYECLVRMNGQVQSLPVVLMR